MKHFQNQKQKQRTLSTKTNHAVGEKNGHRELDEMGRVFAETEGGGGGIKESDTQTCEPESEGEK